MCYNTTSSKDSAPRHETLCILSTHTLIVDTKSALLYTKDTHVIIMSRVAFVLERHHQQHQQQHAVVVAAAKRKTTTTLTTRKQTTTTTTTGHFFTGGPHRRLCDDDASTRVNAASTSRGGEEEEKEEDKSGGGLLVLTFDLDDTIWPTAPVVTAANETYIQWLQTRVEHFPETNVVNELMKGIREEREEMFRKRGEEHVVRFIRSNARSTARAYYR